MKNGIANKSGRNFDTKSGIVKENKSLTALWFIRRISHVSITLSRLFLFFKVYVKALNNSISYIINICAGLENELHHEIIGFILWKVRRDILNFDFTAKLYEPFLIRLPSKFETRKKGCSSLRIRLQIGHFVSNVSLIKSRFMHNKE